jgi:hypothetical protein
MKITFLTITFTFITCLINANIDLCNRVPFDDNNPNGPQIEYNKFGEKRNIKVKSASYDHYNQSGTKQHHAIISSREQNNSIRQSVTLNNNQFNYNQNSNRKVESASATSVNYNAPMQVKTPGTKATTTADDIVIETGDQQNISINPNDGSSNTTTPTVPGGDATPGPIGDAILVLVMLAALYALILRRKA